MVTLTIRTEEQVRGFFAGYPYYPVEHYGMLPDPKTYSHDTLKLPKVVKPNVMDFVSLNSTFCECHPAYWTLERVRITFPNGAQGYDWVLSFLIGKDLCDWPKFCAELYTKKK